MQVLKDGQFVALLERGSADWYDMLSCFLRGAHLRVKGG